MAPVEVLMRCDVTPGSRRAQAGVRLDAEVQAPTMEEEGGGEGPAGPLMGPAVLCGPTGPLVSARMAKSYIRFIFM